MSTNDEIIQHHEDQLSAASAKLISEFLNRKILWWLTLFTTIGVLGLFSVFSTLRDNIKNELTAETKTEIEKELEQFRALAIGDAIDLRAKTTIAQKNVNELTKLVAETNIQVNKSSRSANQIESEAQRMRISLTETANDIESSNHALKKAIEFADSIDDSTKAITDVILDEKSTFRSELTSEISKSLYESSPVVNVYYATGIGPSDSTDSGLLRQKQLIFEKRHSESQMRIAYSDNFRVAGTNKACRWEILLNGKPCPSGALIYDRHDGSNSNVHSSSTVLGYCEALPSGSNIVQINVGPHPQSEIFSNSDCHTGWGDSTWVIEAMEIKR